MSSGSKIRHAAIVLAKRSRLAPLLKKIAGRRHPLAPAFDVAKSAGWESAARWLLSPSGESALSNPDLLRVLRYNINRLVEVELLLVAVRRTLLFDHTNLIQRTKIRDFCCALIQQCINNEYVWFASDDELEYLSGLPFDPAHLNSQASVALDRLLVLAMYRPVHELLGKDFRGPIDTLPPLLRSIVDDTLTAYNEEREIAASIKSVDILKDETSLRVKTQYETFPYPRWITIRLPESGGRRTILEEFFSADELRVIDAPFDVLVAGCGTGRKALQVARGFGPHSKVLGYDLSFASLSYAARMARHHRIENIEFLQGDIMDIPKLGRRFEVVECTGVLHHMADPLAGLAALTQCLKPGGLMHISLYSELARRKIVQLRKEAGFDPSVIEDEDSVNAEFIRRYRYELMLERPEILDEESFPSRGDFFDLSRCRDLIFHIMEHRFTIPQIADALAKLGLEFHGFERPKPSDDKLWSRYPKGSKLASFDHWWKYEQKNPNTFGDLYEIWCRKPT